MSGKRIVAAVLGGALLIAGALPAMADQRSDCERHIRKYEDNLRREIAAHGEHGRKVEERREVLERERANCRMYLHDHEHHDHGWDNEHHDHDMPH
jgi:hypothetical protein